MTNEPITCDECRFSEPCTLTVWHEDGQEVIDGVACCYVTGASVFVMPCPEAFGCVRAKKKKKEEER